jgi:opacity protein-like surface antigen
MSAGLRILNGTSWVALGALLAMAAAAPSRAQETEPAEENERLEAVEAKVEALTDEVGRLESIFAVPEEVALESFSGLGPAASKVYKRESGLSIGGYGEVRLRSFQNQDDDNENDVFDALRAVLYVGYKYNEKWVFNSELEFEHAGTGGGGSVSTEFLTVDYLHADELNFRAGLLLIPMGFVNEIHEPTFFFGAERPEVEKRIMPSTWRENGAGIFGTVAERIHYRLYAVNGFDATGFDRDGLRGGRQKGGRALSDDFAFVGRVDVDLTDGLLVGGSIYAGQSGQEQKVNDELLPDMMTHIYEVHAQYKGYGLSLRGLWSEAFVDEAGAFNRIEEQANLASQMQGWYVEAAYDILPLFRDSQATLEPYFRFEQWDTQHKTPDGITRDGSQDVDLYVAGVQFKPIPQVVFKVDYRHFDQRDGHRANEVQALLGYVF